MSRTVATDRRRALAALGAAGALSLGGRRALGASPAGRVVILGAGWAGLACAYALRRHAPALDVHVVDRDSVFRSLPLSNPWLVGRTGERVPHFALATVAREQGWRFSAADVSAIDRTARVVQTSTGPIAYDWLVLATGAVADDVSWFGGDTALAVRAQRLYPAGFAAAKLDACKRGLEAFAEAGGGTLVMTVPPPPYRCPPAPYERAALIGWWIRTRRLKAKLIVLDAGSGMQRFSRLYSERYGAQIEHRTHAGVRAVDPVRRSIETEFGDLRFDHALLLPAMSAGPLARQAGLLARDAQGDATRWVAADPASLRATVDERVYVAGDVLGNVSVLFGPYPKTAQIAADLGAAVALQIAVASGAQVKPSPAALPRSECHVWLDADPHEMLELDATFRLRGDGLIMQTVRQRDNFQPRDEDLAWARNLLARQLGLRV